MIKALTVWTFLGLATMRVLDKCLNFTLMKLHEPCTSANTVYSASLSWRAQPCLVCACDHQKTATLTRLCPFVSAPEDSARIFCPTSGKRFSQWFPHWFPINVKNIIISFVIRCCVVATEWFLPETEACRVQDGQMCCLPAPSPPRHTHPACQPIKTLLLEVNYHKCYVIVLIRVSCWLTPNEPRLICRDTHICCMCSPPPPPPLLFITMQEVVKAKS